MPAMNVGRSTAATGSSQSRAVVEHAAMGMLLIGVMLVTGVANSLAD
jgi:hypothetical protein